MFSLIRAWTNGWANKRDTGDLRRHRTHYDVTLMWIIVSHRHLVRLTLRSLFNCLIVRFAFFIEIVLVHICNDPYTFKRESVWFSIHMLESVSNAFGPRNTAIGILKFIIKFYLLGHNARVLQYICNRYWLKFIVTACLMLTHWGRDKMDVILQTTVSGAFSLMKMFEFRLNFHWSLFLRAQLTIFQHWFR